MSWRLASSESPSNNSSWNPRPLQLFCKTFFTLYLIPDFNSGVCLARGRLAWVSSTLSSSKSSRHRNQSPVPRMYLCPESHGVRRPGTSRSSSCYIESVNPQLHCCHWHWRCHCHCRRKICRCHRLEQEAGGVAATNRDHASKDVRSTCNICWVMQAWRRKAVKILLCPPIHHTIQQHIVIQVR